MNFIPDKIGGTRKQYMWLGGLGVVLVIVYFVEREPSQPTQPATQVTVPKPSIGRPGKLVPDTSSGPKLATRSVDRGGDFRPTIKLPDTVDITKIDPTLRTDLLAKLQKVPLEGGARSVFDWGAAPLPPPPPPVKIDPVQIAKEQEKAKKDAEERALHPPKPPVPPIPLKFYGYANRQSGPARQAFFLDGEDIQIKGENDVIRGRYKIIRIGINSAVVEDLQSHDQQTLPLVAENT
jgi:hypothetical protein